MTQFETLLTARLKQLRSRKTSMDIFLNNHPMQTTYTAKDKESLLDEIEETKAALKAVSEFNLTTNKTKKQ